MATAPAHVAGPTYSLRSTLASSSFDSRRFHSNGISAYPALRTHSSAKVRAGFDGESSASQHAESISRPVIRRKRSPHAPVNLPSEPDESVSLQTVMVEDEGVALEGVGTVDRGGSLSNPPWGLVGLLAAGDVVALITFAVIGRYSHGFTTLNWDVVRTADPFIAGWLLGSYFLGGYGPDSQGVNGLNRAAVAAVRSWAVGVPLGLAIRGLVTAHVPAQSFILVTLGSLLVLMVSWRITFVYVFSSNEKSLEARPTSRKGGAFEFLQLLTSLVRRW